MSRNTTFAPGDGRRAQTPIHLVAFGGPQLLLDSDHRSLSPLQGALLGLLATEPSEGVPVRRAIKLLWMFAPARKTRHRISQLVYSLNRGFDHPVIVKTGDRYCLGASVATDYRTPSEEILAGKPHRAADILARGFLSDLKTPPTDAFADWLGARCLELRAEVRQASVELWTRLSRQGRWHRAVAPAHALLTLDARDEAALRMLIRARVMSGRVREAQAAYTSFAERAGQHRRNWTPHAETQALIAQIGKLAAASAGNGKSANRELPLVGRDEELAILSAALYSGAHTGLRLIVVRGERGIGKTRLINEALARGSLAGVRLLRGGCSEFEHCILLSPVLEALSAPGAASHILRLGKPWRSILKSVLPEIRDGAECCPNSTGSGNRSEAARLERNQVPRQLSEAVRQLLLALTANRPAVLFIDDLHWADPASLAVLRYLIHRWPARPLAIVLAVQTEGVYAGDLVCRFLADLDKSCSRNELTLSALTASAGRRIVESASELPVPGEVQDRIAALGSGNPFFLLELAKHYLGGQPLPSLHTDKFVPPPDSLLQVFADRLSRLDVDCERTLQFLCVSGHPTHPRELPRQTGLSAETCAHALDHLQRAKLIRWTPRGLVLHHRLVRHAVYAGMSTSRRASVHIQVARYLEESGDETASGELAFHYHHAHLRDRSREHALAGALRAETAGDAGEASALLSLGRRNTDDPHLKARISTRLAHHHYARRDPAKARSHLKEAASRLRKADQPQRALIAELQRIDLLAGTGVYSPRDALAKLRRSRRKSEEKRLWEAFAKAVYLDLRIRRGEGQARPADELLDSIRTRLDRVTPPARSILLTCLARHSAGDFDTALDHIGEAVSIARGGGDGAYEDLLRALACLVRIQGFRARIGTPEVASIAEEVQAPVPERENFVERYLLQSNIGSGHLSVGKLDLARHWFQRAERTLKEVHPCCYHIWLACHWGTLALAERDLVAAQARFDYAQTRWTPRMSRYLGVISHSGAGLTALLSGRLDQARCLERRLPDRPATWFEDPYVFALFRAKMHERRGRPGCPGSQRHRRRNQEITARQLDQSEARGSAPAQALPSAAPEGNRPSGSSKGG